MTSYTHNSYWYILQILLVRGHEEGQVQQACQAHAVVKGTNILA